MSDNLQETIRESAKAPAKASGDAIIERIENANKHLEPLPEAIDVIQQYGALVERLHNADRVKLAHAISLTVASISIESRAAKTATSNIPSWSADCSSTNR